MIARQAEKQAMDTFRWGIIGPGRIAGRFVEDLKVLPGMAVTAVAGRSPDRTAAFARANGIGRVHAEVHALIDDAGIDAIYVATPHTSHHAFTCQALAAGRPVLCEKPLAVNLVQAQAMIEAARSRRTFLMEAMWTRFLPIMTEVRAWIDAGHIGEPRMVQASFGFRCPWEPQSRLLDPHLAGGSLLDVGVYPIAFALWVFGQPAREVTALANLGATGVDEQTGMVLSFTGGRLAVLTSAVRTQTDHSAWILGTEGRILVGPPFWKATTAVRFAGMQEVARLERPLLAHGFEYEAQEVARCVRVGLNESPHMSWADSLELARICDQVRARIGLVYPFE